MAHIDIDSNLFCGVARSSRVASAGAGNIETAISALTHSCRAAALNISSAIACMARGMRNRRGVSRRSSAPPQIVKSR